MDTLFKTFFPFSRFLREETEIFLKERRRRHCLHLRKSQEDSQQYSVRISYVRLFQLTRVCVHCFTQLSPLEVLTLWWRGNLGFAFLCWPQRETVSQSNRQTTGRKRNWVDDQINSENLQTDRQASRRLNGKVETHWWSQPVPPNDRVTQMENKEGEEKGKHCHSHPRTLAPPHFLGLRLSYPLVLPSPLVFQHFSFSYLWIEPLLSHFPLVFCHLLRIVTCVPLISPLYHIFSHLSLLSILVWVFSSFSLPPVWTDG